MMRVFITSPVAYRGLAYSDTVIPIVFTPDTPVAYRGLAYSDTSVVKVHPFTFPVAYRGLAYSDTAYTVDSESQTPP
ncbi:MAG: hypothetical protein ABIG42_03390 [bacterium]